MTSHYFTNDSKLNDELNLIEEVINGNKYRFYTDGGVFSKKRVDFGSLLLIESLLKDLKTEDNFLDLGCGYGPIGIVIKKQFPEMDVHLTDINEKAVLLANKNSELNKVKTKCYSSKGFENITENFAVISLNPPIRAGKKAVFELYKSAHQNLITGGNFWIVIRKKHGAFSHLEYLKKLFKKTEIIRKNKGYFVIYLQKWWIVLTYWRI